MGIKDYAIRHGTEKVINTVEKRLKLRAYSGINCYDADGHLPGNKLINNETAYQLFSGHGPRVVYDGAIVKGKRRLKSTIATAFFFF
jgi:hypothetical protein